MYENRTTTLGGISMNHISPIFEQRAYLGKYELDFMLTNKHKRALPILLDRTTLLTELKKLCSKHESNIKKTGIQLLSQYLFPVETIIVVKKKTIKLYRTNLEGSRNC